jgi:hypothetical protein
MKGWTTKNNGHSKGEVQGRISVSLDVTARLGCAGIASAKEEGPRLGLPGTAVLLSEELAR